MSATNHDILDFLEKHKIVEVLYRYCHACDHMDEEALRSCFHPDSHHTHGPYDGPTSDWIPAALQWLKGRVAVSHMVTNPLITVIGKRAVSDCHFVAYNRLPRAGNTAEELVVKGRYIDRFENRDGTWKIAHRLGIHDLERVYEISADGASIPMHARSGPKRDDPYFEILAEYLGR